MKVERTKNAIRNIRYGIVLKIYQMLLPFLMRTVMIHQMGVQYLGLNSLFTSVLQVLNLAELGVGSAMVYSMYRPLATDDDATICALMKLYRTYYRIIGLVIAVIGNLLTPFIPRLISGTTPEGVNIYILYLLNLGATVLSYWLFAYKNSILQASQRVDVVNKVLLITNTLQFALQLMVLVLFKNYYYYLIVALGTQMLTNITTALAATKLYPQYKPKGDLDKGLVDQIKHRLKDLFTSKIGMIIYDSADTIIISAFLGLSVLAIYQNYFYILTAVTAFISIFFSACTAGIGNSLVVETKEKNFDDFSKFTMIISWMSGFCSTCMLCIYQPFMELWVGKDLMLPFSAVICFVVYFFVRQINSLYNLYKDAAGMWHEDRFRPIITSMANLVLNLILVQFWGIYGVLISTVAAIIFVGMPWLFCNLFTVIFEKKHMLTHLKKLFSYIVVTLISCLVTYFICSLISWGLIATMLIRAFICLVIPNAIYCLAYRKTAEFQNILVMADNITKGKCKGIIKLLECKK